MAEYLNEQFTTIDNWTAQDVGNGVSSLDTTTFSGKVLKLDSVAAAGNDEASRFIQLSANKIPENYQLLLKVYHNDLRNTFQDFFELNIFNGNVVLKFRLRTRGAYISGVEVDTDDVANDVWQIWKINVKDDSADLYLDDTLKASDKSVTSDATNDGLVKLFVVGDSAVGVSYTDYIIIKDIRTPTRLGFPIPYRIPERRASRLFE